MQEMEEEVLDMHKATIDISPRWQQMDISLLNMTNEVDYDVDGGSAGGAAEGWGTGYSVLRGGVEERR